MKEFKPDRSRFKDEKGRYIVQGLFLEDKYNTSLAMYTFDGEDKTYKGVVFPSLKRLFLEEGDPEEYTFANKYLYDWDHWQRLCKNAIISRQIERWRDELYLSLRSEGMATLIDLAINEKSYQAAKWLADEGWVKQKRGRPSKQQIEDEVKRRAQVEEQFADDFQLLQLHQGGKK
jgi:hypothetical protein